MTSHASAELSSALYQSGGRVGYLATLDHAFNHSLWKLAALQAQHGWRSFIVCFEKNPKPTDAERYCAAGLVWCTLKTLPQLLIRIELDAAGVPISFVHTAQKFTFKIEFDNGTATATAAEVRSQYLANVDADKVAVAAQRAKDAADEAAGILPF